jgi:MFS family permease
MLRALRIRDFRLLWGAGLISSLGTWLLVLAVPAHVFLVTRSLAATGFTLAADYLPLLLFGPVAGVLTDRWDRRRVMVSCNVFRAAAVAAMLAGLAPGRFWVFYLALAAESSGTALFSPAEQAFTPDVVGTGPLLTGANALDAVTSAVVRLAGGPLGGVLFAAFGIKAMICADTLSYLISAAVLLGISRPAGQAQPVRPAAGRSAGHAAHRMTVRAARRDLADGLCTLRADAMARTLLPVTMLFLAANSALDAVVVPFGLRRLGGVTQTGILFAALGVGFGIGAPVFRLLADRLEPRNLLTAALTVVAAGFFLLFRTSTLSQALPCAVALGLSGSLALAIPQTEVQRSVPGAALGRVSGAFLTAEAAATLVGAVAGPALAQAVQLGGAATIASLTTLAGAAVAILRMPTVRGSASARPPGSSPGRGRRRLRTRRDPGSSSRR